MNISNNEMRFKHYFLHNYSFLKEAKKLGADYIATGHYARIDRLPNGRFAIRNSVTASKDQTYALYKLTQFQLSHTLMPAGDYTKDEIRDIAKRLRLPVAHKPDSQEICFIPDNDYAGFDVKESWEWSKKWLSVLSGKAAVANREKWMDQLAEFHLV